MTPRSTFFALTLVFILEVPAILAAGEPPVLRAAPATGPLRIDGLPDEPEWAGAGVIEDLTQQDPHPGEPTAWRTEVRVLADRDTLYVAFRCIDPEPDRVAVHTLQRDGNLEGDDRVMLVLDTYLDNRTGYYFSMNAEGAREDGLISGPEASSADWDGIWSGRAQRTPDGWSAEFAIPARTLHFTPGAPEWGFNVERVVPRQRLHLRWTGATLDATLIDMRRTGRLAGVQHLRQGLGLTFVPYGLDRYEWSRQEGGSNEPDVGGEVYDNFTPGLTGVLTVNTDFAETETDVQQINLTRFPLFFPEKRAFFLESSTQFDFGLGLDSSLIPFFSRRIGLVEGRRVPILGGAELLGRAGRWGIGLLDAYTGDLGPEGDLPAMDGSNLAAGRVTYDASDRLRVGVIATDGDPAGIDRNHLFGADGVWQKPDLFGDKNFATGGWWVRSAGDTGRGDRNGYGFKVDYPNDLWDIALNVRHFGDALDPKLGFLPRRGIDSYSAGVAFQPRPGDGNWRWVRQFFFELEPSVVRNLDGVTESWSVFTAPFNIVTRHNDHFEVNWEPQYERLFEPFEIAPGVVIPPGEYQSSRYRVQAESSSHRIWSAAATVWFGDFLSGRLTQTILSSSLTTPRGAHRFELSSENDYGSMPEGDFIERLHVLRWAWSLSPDLGLSVLSQYESRSRTLGLNARLRWTIRPGDDLFLVWTRNWLDTEPEGGPGFRRESDALVAKARWTFRL